VGWLLTAVAHAVVILACVLAGAGPMRVDRSHGHPRALGQDGVLMFSVVIVTVHAQLASIIDHWTWAHHASCWGSIGEQGPPVLGGGGLVQQPAKAGSTTTAPEESPGQRPFKHDNARLCSALPLTPHFNPKTRPRAALWFLFLLVYGAFPVRMAADLHKFFAGAVANNLFFWLTVAIIAGLCVLPTFVARAAARYLSPRYYQVVQELAAREARGEDVMEGCALGVRGAKPAAGIAARASRLIQRKALRAGSSTGGTVAAALRRRYSGFVPPYEARSRVFDTNELFASAAAAGYTISQTGEVIIPPPMRTATTTGAFGTQAGGGTWGSEPQGAGPPSPGGGSPGRVSIGPFSTSPGGGPLARAISGIGAMTFHRRTVSTGPFFHGGSMPTAPSRLEATTLPGATAPACGAGALPPIMLQQPPPFLPGGLTRISAGTSGGSGGGGGFGLPSSSGGAAEAVPQIAGDDVAASYASNPVLAQLEREFTRDPRRHRRGIKLSLLNLPRIRSRSPKGRVSRSGSPVSRAASYTGLRAASFDGGGGSLEGDSAEAEAARRMVVSEGGETRTSSSGPELQMTALGNGGWAVSGDGGNGAGAGKVEPFEGGGGVPKPQRWLAPRDDDGPAMAQQAPGHQQQLHLQQGPPPPHPPPNQPAEPHLPAPVPPAPKQDRQEQQQTVAQLPMRQPASAVPRQQGSQPPGAAWQPLTSTQQQHRSPASPSRLLRMAAHADPPPTHVSRMGAAAEAVLEEPLVAEGPRRASAATEESERQVPAAGVELQTEDPAMLRLFEAALQRRRPTQGSAGGVSSNTADS
jgi:hypothetical protein